MLEKESDFLKDPSEILKALMESKGSGNAIGIHAIPLGDGIYVTGIEDIFLDDSDTTIILKPYDNNGYILPTTHILLSDVISVFPFVSELKNPFLKNMVKERSWFF